MLVSLHVKNLALIDETEVYFKEGLNILSGETGAGKSIIIGSINLALGARADKEMIRNGAEYALVELVFQADTKEQIKVIQDMDISIEEDGMILIQRKIMPNRSICKICGENATTKLLKDLSGILIDIHGQHEHQSLLYPKKHMEILDDFCGKELETIVTDIKKNYHSYLEIKEKLEETSLDSTAKEKEASLAQFEIEEIENAKLVIGEDEELEASYKKMTHAKKIGEGTAIAYACTGYEQGAGELLGRAVRELKSVAEYDDVLKELESQAEELDSMLNDFNRSLSDYIDDLELDEQDFVRTQERLNLINHFKVKYGNSIEAILEYQEKQQEFLEKLLNYDAYKQKLEEELKVTEQKLNALCEEASKIRKQKALVLQEQMKQALLDLNFIAVLFEIQVRQKEHFGENGWDEVEFMISTNPGEPIKPLGYVASGGELSRIMLALKTVLAKKDEIHTLIFDEIDAGISGKTAWKVSEKLAVLGQNHQIICITHLPQIAAMADNHFVIEKESNAEKTTTSIKEIDEQEMIMELARLLGGDVLTDAVILNAKDLKELARKTKQY